MYNKSGKNGKNEIHNGYVHYSVFMSPRSGRAKNIRVFTQHFILYVVEKDINNKIEYKLFQN